MSAEKPEQFEQDVTTAAAALLAIDALVEQAAARIVVIRDDPHFNK